MDNIKEFIEEYEILCQRTGLCVEALTDGTTGIVQIDEDFEATLRMWREDLREG